MKVNKIGKNNKISKIKKTDKINKINKKVVQLFVYFSSIYIKKTKAIFSTLLVVYQGDSDKEVLTTMIKDY